MQQHDWQQSCPNSYLLLRLFGKPERERTSRALSTQPVWHGVLSWKAKADKAAIIAHFDELGRRCQNVAQQVEVEHARTSRVVDMGQKPLRSMCDTDSILNCFATFHRQEKLQGNFALGIQEVL